MDTKLKAIPTKYKGIEFRSRLEARWAIFFDHVGIKWFYEFEGYALSKAGWYLPDFFFPSFGDGVYAEVKPDIFTDEELAKCAELACISGRSVLLCEGVPDYKIIRFIEPQYISGGNVDWISSGLPNFDQASGEDRMYGSPGFENEDGSIDLEFLDEWYINAIDAARSAKFEFI